MALSGRNEDCNWPYFRFDDVLLTNGLQEGKKIGDFQNLELHLRNSESVHTTYLRALGRVLNTLKIMTRKFSSDIHGVELIYGNQ